MKETNNILWGNSSIGRALALQASGRGFDSRFLHQNLKLSTEELNVDINYEYREPNKTRGHSERSKSDPRIGVAGRVFFRWQYTTVSLGSQKLDGLRRP